MTHQERQGEGSTVIDAHRHRADRPMTLNPLVGTGVYILLIALAWAWAPLTPLWATDAGTPTPVPTQTGSPPTAAPTTIEPAHTAIALTATSTPLPTATISEPRTSNAPEPPNVAEPTATPTPSPTAIPAVQPGTAHLAILVSECVVAVGGTASSEVLVHLEDARPGIVGLRLVLHFDPQVVHVQQVAASAFFEGTQAIGENQADNTRGQIALTLVQANRVPVSDTASWQKVATIVWIGRQAGNTALTIGEQSGFTGLDGRVISPNALHHSTAFVRLPGQIRGQVLLQGRAEHGNTQISSSLAAARINRSYTGLDGSFVLTATHGEGFYTLSASAAGYLTAEGSRPIKLAVGSEVELAPVTLLGGDINQDDLIDIRDLSYVAYHLGGPDAQSDINGDGQVDILDLTMIAGNFGKKGPTTWPTSD